MKKKIVSIIITTHNSGKFIKACLDSVVNQDYPKKDYEIIVVDNFSKDKTYEIVKSYRAVHFFQKGPERSSQRNFGAKKATGKYLLFLDSDMTISKNLITDCVSKIGKQPRNKRKFIALYIPEIILGNSYWCKVRRFERSFYNATVIDATRFIKQEVFLQSGGYNEQLTGPEDWDLDLRLKKFGRFEIATSPLFHNEANFTLKHYLAKKKYYSNSMPRYIEKWPKRKEVKQQFSPFYRLFTVFLENGKWKKFISNPKLVFGIYYLRLRIGLNYLGIKK